VPRHTLGLFGKKDLIMKQLLSGLTDFGTVGKVAANGLRLCDGRQRRN